MKRRISSPLGWEVCPLQVTNLHHFICTVRMRNDITNALPAQRLNVGHAQRDQYWPTVHKRPALYYQENIKNNCRHAKTHWYLKYGKEKLKTSDTQIVFNYRCQANLSFFLALWKKRELKEKLKKVIGFLVWDNLIFNSLKARHLEATSTTFTHAQTFDRCLGLIWDLFIWSSLSWPTFRP